MSRHLDFNERSEVVAQLDRPVDAVMEVYDASKTTEDAEPLLVISGDRAALVRCY